MSTTPPSFTDPEVVARYFDRLGTERDRWKQKNRFHYESIENLYRFHMPPGWTVLNIGSSTGDLLHAYGNQGPDRGVEEALQRGQAAQCLEVSAAGT